MDVINSTELNFSKSAVTHFVKMLDERGKGKGIKLGIKKAGCSGYELSLIHI